MTVLTVFGDTADDYIGSSNPVYSSAQAGSGLTLGGGTSLRVGQILTGGIYGIYESFIGFDTSPLGASATVSQVDLTLYTVADNSTTDFTIRAYAFDWGVSVTTADWQNAGSLAGLTNCATFATSGLAGAGGANLFTENGTNFRTNINKTGFTRLVLGDQNMPNNVAPTTNEYVDFSSADTAGTTTDPKLVVTYASPLPVTPTVGIAVEIKPAVINATRTVSPKVPVAVEFTIASTVSHTTTPTVGIAVEIRVAVINATRQVSVKVPVAVELQAAVHKVVAAANPTLGVAVEFKVATVTRHRIRFTSDELLAGRGAFQWTIRYDVLDAHRNVMPFQLEPYAVGSITWDPTNRIQRILDGLKLDPGEATKLTRGQSWVRPVFEIPSIGYEHPLGVFAYLGGPRRKTAGEWWVDCEPLWDRGYQLDQGVARPVGVSAYELLTDALVRVAAGAGIAPGDIDVHPSTRTLGGEPLAFPVGSTTTRFGIVQQIVGLLGYLPAGFDQNDVLVSGPVPIPTDEDPLFRYTSGADAVVIDDTIVEVESVADKPNTYIVLTAQPSASPMFGVFTIDAAEENSLERITFPIVKSKTIDGATDATQLNAAAKAWAQEDRATVRTIEFETGPDPRRDRWDVIEFDDGDVIERLLGSYHQFNLEAGIMRHRARKVYLNA